MLCCFSNKRGVSSVTLNKVKCKGLTRFAPAALDSSLQQSPDLWHFLAFFILSTYQPLAKHRLSSKGRLINGSALSLSLTIFFHLHTKWGPEQSAAAWPRLICIPMTIWLAESRTADREDIHQRQWDSWESTAWDESHREQDSELWL